MTKIYFHTNIYNILLYTCNITRDIYKNGYKIIILTNKNNLYNLDKLLWSFSPIDFIPHCIESNSIASKTPIILTSNIKNHYDFQVLVNLNSSIPEKFSYFIQLIEIVSYLPEEMSLARIRYLFYKKHGYYLKSINKI